MWAGWKFWLGFTQLSCFNSCVYRICSFQWILQQFIYFQYYYWSQSVKPSCSLSWVRILWAGQHFLSGWVNFILLIHVSIGIYSVHSISWQFDDFQCQYSINLIIPFCQISWVWNLPFLSVCFLYLGLSRSSPSSSYHEFVYLIGQLTSSPTFNTSFLYVYNWKLCSSSDYKLSSRWLLFFVISNRVHFSQFNYSICTTFDE